MSHDLNIGTLEFKVKNRYRLTRVNASEEIVEQSGWSNNLMTNHGFDSLLGGSHGFVGVSCVVGAGNTTPSESDEYLDSYLYGTSNMTATVNPTYNTTVSPRYVKYAFKWRFNPQGSSYTVSEVGVGFSPGGSPAGTTSTQRIGSRSLVVDSGGSPTSVSVLSDEYLDVEWELYYYVPEDAGGTVSVTVDGTPVSTTWTVRGALMSGSTWPPVVAGVAMYLRPLTFSISDTAATRLFETTTLGAYSAIPSGSAGNVGSNVWSPSSYTAGSKTRNWELTLNLAVGNFSGGVGSCQISPYIRHFQMRFSPALAKTAARVGKLNFTLSMSNV